MGDKGSLSKARRICKELDKLLDLVDEDEPFKGIHQQSTFALQEALIRARRCTSNIMAELGDEKAYSEV